MPVLSFEQDGVVTRQKREGGRVHYLGKITQIQVKL